MITWERLSVYIVYSSIVTLVRLASFKYYIIALFTGHLRDDISQLAS